MASDVPDQWYADLFADYGPKIGYKFRPIGTYLNLEAEDLDGIEKSNQHDAASWGANMLTMWRKKNAKLSHADLMAMLYKALSRCGRVDLQVKIEKEDKQRVAAQQQAKQTTGDQAAKGDPGAKDELDNCPPPPTGDPEDADQKELDSRLKKLKESKCT